MHVIDGQNSVEFKRALTQALKINAYGSPVRSPRARFHYANNQRHPSAIEEDLSQSRFANQQLVRQMQNQMSTSHRNRVRNGAILDGCTREELEDVEQQIREQESLLAGYRRENEHLAEQLQGRGMGYQPNSLSSSMPVPASIPIGGGTFIPSNPAAPNPARSLGPPGMQHAAFVTNACEMLAQISERISTMDLSTKELFQNWSHGSRFSMTVEQLSAGLRSIGLFCATEVSAALLSSFDRSGEGLLGYGDFVKLVHQVTSHYTVCIL